MPSSEQYNGWSNYETWAVNMWLTNDQGTDEAVRELVGQVHDDEGRTQTRYAVADALKDFVDDLAEQTCPGCIEGASFVSDLLGAALSSVNWQEIAASFLEDVD